MWHSTHGAGHQERSTRHSPASCEWAELWGLGGGRGEAGPGARRGSASRVGVQMGPMLHKPARVLRSMWKLYLLSVDRWSQVLLTPCVLLALCPTPQHPLVSLKEFLCPEWKRISCIRSVFLNSGGHGLPWILGFPGRAKGSTRDRPLLVWDWNTLWIPSGEREFQEPHSPQDGRTHWGDLGSELQVLLIGC